MPDDTKQAAETTYPQERLVADANAFFGHPSHVVVGALHGQTKKTFTVSETKKLIDKFLSRKVEPKPAASDEG